MNIETNSDNAINRNGKLWQVVAGILKIELNGKLWQVVASLLLLFIM